MRALSSQFPTTTDGEYLERLPDANEVRAQAESFFGHKVALHHDGLSRPLPNPRLRVLSLGAGVQSTTLALMAARGEIEAPDCAIFADTQSEPAAVYKHLAWLEGVLPFPVHRISKGSLREQLADAAAGRAAAHDRPPLFVRNLATGRVGMTQRQCTRDYKIKPIKGEVRRLLGLRRGQQMRHFLGLKTAEVTTAIVEQWIGISTDEIQRLKRSDEAYIHLRHPLIEARMSRADCIRWLSERQYPTPPKSACTFCTYHNNAQWRSIRDGSSAEWADVLEVDRGLRAHGRHKNMRELMFLHRQCIPLSEVDLSADEPTPFGFENECEGMCGV